MKGCEHRGLTYDETVSAAAIGLIFATRQYISKDGDKYAYYLKYMEYAIKCEKKKCNRHLRVDSRYSLDKTDKGLHVDGKAFLASREKAVEDQVMSQLFYQELTEREN